MKRQLLAYPFILVCGCNLNPQGEDPGFEESNGTPGSTGVTDGEGFDEGPRFGLAADGGGLEQDDFFDDSDTADGEEGDDGDTDETEGAGAPDTEDTDGAGDTESQAPEEEDTDHQAEPEVDFPSDADASAYEFESSDAGVPNVAADGGSEEEPPMDAGSDGGDGG